MYDPKKYKYNPVVKTDVVEGEWFKIHPRQRFVHFLPKSDKKTLCGTYIPTLNFSDKSIEGEIITVPSVSQCTIRPKQLADAFVSAGSTSLLAGEILIFGGITDVGEASGERESQTHLDVRLENNIKNSELSLSFFLIAQTT